jgi:PAS domain S-box-containing protein
MVNNNSSDYYLTIFEEFPALIWRSGLDGRCNYFNLTWLQFRGRNITEELEEGWTEGLHPEDLDPCLQTYLSAFSAREPFELQFRLRNHNGEYRWIKGIGRPYRGPDGVFAGYIGFCFDITEHKKSLDSLKKSDELLRKVFAAVPDIVLVLNRERRVIHSNWHGFLNHVPESVRASEPLCHEILLNSSSNFCESCQTLIVLDSGETTVVEMSLPGYGLFEVRTYPIFDDSGNVGLVIQNFRDITEQRRTEEQLLHAQKMEAVGTLAGGIAHDFNNILTAIVGYSNLLLTKINKEDPHRESLRKIMDAAEQAASLTRGLLTYSRKSPPALNPVDLNEIIARNKQFLSRIIGEDIEIEIRAIKSKLYVMADAGQIAQVIMNLATNARDAMPGGGRLIIDTGETSIDNEFINAHGYGRIGRYALLTISDMGCGMDRGTRQRIFEPFFTTKEVGKGTGLGLSIVYGITKQHKGYISVHSEPGEGTSFRIYIPLTELRQDEVPHKEPIRERGKGETILIIEDNEEIRTFLGKLLIDFGYQVLTAENGVAGLEKFRDRVNEIDLVIVDVIMPLKDGMTTLDEIRSVARGIKALFISGYTADVISSRGISTAGVEMLTKPFNPFVLLAKIRQILDCNSTGRPLTEA